jgi:purine nucleosidase
MNRLVIDTDPGVDDAHALMMVFADPDTEVVALTTVAGNVSLESATRNALIVLDVVSRDVPVYPGCEDALVIPTARRAISHGKDGLGDSGYAASTRRAQTEHAAMALIRLANEFPGELTLVALGPLSNIALALRLDPTLPQKFKQLVVMGGAVHCHGNSWERSSEFNFYCDPEAAAVVFSCWPMLTLLPWETALSQALLPEQVEELARSASPRGELFRRTIQKRFVEKEPGHQVLSEPDPLALAVILEPGIVRKHETRFVEIELAGQFTRGQSIVDWVDLMGRPHNTDIVLEVDRGRFMELMKRGLE